jgi:hypothetical protein
MSLVVLPPAPRSLSFCRYEYCSQASLRRNPLEEVLSAYRSVHKSILNADKVSSLRSPWPSYAQVRGGRPNDLRRIVSLPLPLFPCQTLLEHFHLPFPLAISRSNRRFVYIQRVRPPAPPHKILETLQRHWKHPLLTDVVRMLARVNIVAPRWHHLRSRRYLPWAPQAQLANSLAVIYHLTCAPSNFQCLIFC